ncbi:MAG TPA: NAD+ synthase [Bacteroidales bacterium]|nr:NAD+ synthase [Bacteroidales bacterium]
MKIAIAQMNFTIGHFEKNKRLIIEAISDSRQRGADLVVFSELSVCGYPPHDLLESDSFAELCSKSVAEIATHCNDIAAIVGAPVRNQKAFGKRLYNAAFFLQHGQIQAIYRKGLLPTYDVFDEYRYFEPETDFQVVPFKNKRIALTICEDIWNLGEPALYAVNPMYELTKQNPDFVVNISASPFAWNHLADRFKTFSETARKYQLPLFVSNQVGGHTDLLFDGSSGAFNPKGGLVGSLGAFTEGIEIFDLESVMRNTVSPVVPAMADWQKCKTIYQALVFGIKEYFGKLGFKKAILGLSGGLDSALVLTLAVEALGAENCMAILLPGPYSSEHSISDSLQLVHDQKVNYDIISISQTYGSIIDSLNVNFAGYHADVAEENIQARIRAVVLMALANKLGYVLLNTSNKSEAAVGYGTLYGDMCGGLSVIGDIYKTEAYSLARYINREKEIIPASILHKEPSAELKPNQRDTDSLPPYEILDKILFRFIELNMPAADIIASGFDADTVHRVIRMVNLSEFKRYQAPPVLRVSKKAFGSGRKMPLVARYPE